jgi:PPP family 3-phenylpropionic acid transporter
VLHKLKFLYFFIWNAIGIFFPFISVYYRETGLSGTQIGTIGMVNSFVGAISATLWGVFYDRTGKLRYLLGVTSTGAILSALLLSQMETYFSMLVVAAVMTFFAAPLIPLLDSITIRALGPRSGEYGSYRMFGTLGFMACSAIGGFLFERFTMKALFPVYALGILIFTILAFTLEAPPVKLARSPLAGIRDMVRLPAWLVFAGSIFLLWFAAMGAIGFLGVTVKEMGGSDKLVGLGATVAAATEIPFFFFSSRLLNRFGADKLTAASFLFYSMRLSLYAIMPAPEFVPVINLINGISYVPFNIGSVQYANSLAPEELKSSSLGLMATVLSLAGMAGIWVGGWLFDHTGPSGMFIRMAFICLAAYGLFWVGGKIKKRTTG